MPDAGVPSIAFVINLPGMSKRWASAENQARRGGWTDIRRVEGVQGKRLTWSDRRRNATPFCSLFCTYGQLGAALAHMKAWKTFLNTGAPTALILEDDIILKEKTRTQLKREWSKVPDDFDVLLLGCILGCYRSASEAETFFTYTGAIRKAVWSTGEIEVLNDRVHVPTCVRGLQGYIVSRKGAHRLLYELQGKIDGHIDVAMDRIIGLKVLSWHPEVAFQVNKASVSSIANSGVPKLLTNFGDRVHLQNNLTLSYGLTCPMWGLGDLYHVNGITIIWFILGILFALMALFRPTRTVAIVLASCVLLVYSLDILYEPISLKTWHNVLITLLLVLGPASIVLALRNM